MEWEVELHQEAVDLLAKVPAKYRPQFDNGFQKLVADPKKEARSPALPFCKGPIFEFWIRAENGTRNCVTCFLVFDDEPSKRKVYVHKIILNPPLNPEW